MTAIQAASQDRAESCLRIAAALCGVQAAAIVAAGLGHPAPGGWPVVGAFVWILAYPLEALGLAVAGVLLWRFRRGGAFIAFVVLAVELGMRLLLRTALLDVWCAADAATLILIAAGWARFNPR